MAVLLTTEPSGARLPDREADGARHAHRARALRREDDLVGVDAVALDQQLAHARAALAALPLVEHVAERPPVHRLGVQAQQAEVAQPEHHLGHAAGEEDAHGRVVDGPVGQHADDPRHRAVDARPVLDGGPPQARGVGDRRHVQQEVGGAAERGVHDHRVVHGVVGDDVPGAHAREREVLQRARRAPRELQPHGLTGRRERGVAERHPERLGHDLRRRRGAEELAAAAGRRAGGAAELGGLAHRQLAVREAHADRLHRARVLAHGRRQRHAAGHDDDRQVALRRQREHHRGQALVARRHAHHAAPRGQRPDQAAEHDRGVVAVGEALHHPERALRAPVARVAHEARERRRATAVELLRGLLHEQADLPVSRVVPERDRPPVRCADAALRAEDQELRAAQAARLPAHARRSA